MSLRDSYNPGGGGDKALRVHTQNYISQTFLTTSQYRVTEIILNLRKYVTWDSGIFYVGIFAVDVNNHPTGDALATDLLDFDNLSTSFTDITFTFTGAVLSNATTYAIVCWTTGRDDTYWNSVESGGYSDGAAYFSYDSGASYGTATAIDCLFIVNGIDPEPKIANTPSPTDAQANQPSDVTLNWTNGDFTDTIDVFFDDFTPPTTKVIDNLDVSSYDPSGLAVSDTFYWRVNTKNAYGTTTGTIWSFETGPQIAVGNKTELQAMKDNPTASYFLTANIDVSGAWTPIGNLTDGSFLGTLDGRDYTVSNLAIDTSSFLQGLFGIIDGGALIYDLTIDATSVECAGPGGCFAGWVGEATITNVHVTGASTVTAKDIPGYREWGGFIGRGGNNCTIYNCSADVDVSSIGSTDFIGGFIGYTAGVNFNCQKSYATGNVTTTGLHAATGGFVGRLTGGIIADCYATGAVNADGGEASVGGFVGYNYSDGTAMTSYSIGAVTNGLLRGGFCGDNLSGGAITDCYYDSVTSGQSDTGKGIPKTTANMKKLATFENWSF